MAVGVAIGPTVEAFLTEPEFPCRDSNPSFGVARFWKEVGVLRGRSSPLLMDGVAPLTLLMARLTDLTYFLPAL